MDNEVNESFLDLVFNILMIFFMLLVLTIIKINPEAKNKDIELKAELVITLEWDKKSKDDVDLMIKTPDGRVIFYGMKDGKLASLDRDDQGHLNDIVEVDGKRHIIEENWEHITVRKLVPGWYTVTAFMFHKRERRPTEITFKIDKLNPYYSNIYSGSKIMSANKQEVTILSFYVDSSGNIKSMNTVQKSNIIHLER